jgi:enamine deaminase RidA (YjgF/YER057c/UK114 family)
VTMERVNHRDGTAFEQLAAYSRAVRKGSRIVVSGTAATAPDGSVLAPGDAYEQARVAIERALAAVVALGGTREDVVLTRLLLAPGADWRAAVRAHAEAFAGIDPANTTWFVGGLIPPGALLELELEAIVDEPT